ncbi:hypothetical protein HPB51_023803 [Rhipicephalus microplus]|uniref:Uncharacterized protein n=1 Tax=Rhipicephalus microplus TaxID=6941 RepID=A0A9J6DDC8_RHIMP|nr:hypothetical protein HPB51_023803 [Rhipicephalus microplus]
MPSPYLFPSSVIPALAAASGPLTTGSAASGRICPYINLWAEFRDQKASKDSGDTEDEEDDDFVFKETGSNDGDLETREASDESDESDEEQACQETSWCRKAFQKPSADFRGVCDENEPLQEQQRETTKMEDDERGAGPSAGMKPQFFYSATRARRPRFVPLEDADEMFAQLDKGNLSDFGDTEDEEDDDFVFEETWSNDGVLETREASDESDESDEEQACQETSWCRKAFLEAVSRFQGSL